MTSSCNTSPPICENAYDEDGNLIGSNGGLATGGSSCTTQPNGDQCPTVSADKSCKPWQLSRTQDNCVIDNFVNESIAIGGADINVFKLLGIHEQGRLIDLTGSGSSISNGDKPGYSSDEAFTTYVTEWRSAQVGTAVIKSGYIGYDFGEIRLDTGRNRYSVDTSIKHNISTIKIKQGNNSKNRATKIRVERSADSIKWYGAAILTLPDDDCLNTIHFRNTVPMRYWRLRPIEFNGGSANYWAVQALELIDYDLTSIEDIQDKIWNENRDRDYADQSIRIKGSYDLTDIQTDLTRFGIELPSQTLAFQISFNASVAGLGRPIVIGDIFEVPSELQYNPKLEPIKKYMEVTDVAWDVAGYTPGWKPTIQHVTTSPMLATQETADIFGGLEGYKDDTGFFDNFDKTHGMDDGQHPIIQDQSDVSQTIEQTATDEDHLPERGRDPADITQFSEDQKDAAEEQQSGAAQGLENIGLSPKQLYVEDGLPPNGLPYTEGDSFPGNPGNGVWHRLTYTAIDDTLPARLFRYSAAKGRWVYMETDRRSSKKLTKPTLQEFLGSSTRKPADKIGK